MRIQIVFAVLVLAAVFTSHQPLAAKSASGDTVSKESADSSQLRSELAALRDAALADEYAYQKLAHLTDNIGPRPTGSPQAKAAVQ
jgi:carboxypeptidase Q